MRTLLIIFFVALRFAGQAQIDWSIDEEFKGKVKLYRTTSYSEDRAVKVSHLSDSVADYNIIETKVIRFNEFGQPISHLLYTNEGDTIGSCEWEYDHQGRVIKQTDYREIDRLERTIE